MNQLAHTKQLGDILLRARALLNDEALAKQNNGYQSWVASAAQEWKTRGLLLPPYSIPLVYPLQKDIVNKALELYNSEYPATIEELIEEPIVEPIVEPIEELIEEPIIETIEEPIIEPIEADVLADQFTSLLTKWGGQGHY
jgi:hypothetical protein